VFGVRFRVFPSFFFITALVAGLLLYLVAGIRNPVVLAIGIAIDVGCLFVAILFVSLVQGLVYRSYGLRSTVVVREFISGIYPEAPPPTALQRIVVALAFSASAFLLFALVYFSDQEYHWSRTSDVAAVTYFFLWAVSLFWGIVGLLPVFPYPGGRVMLEVMTLLSPRNGLNWTLWVSVLVGGAYVAYTAAVWLNYMREQVIVPGVVLPASIILAVFFLLAVMNNWQALQEIRAMRRGYQDPVEDDYGDHAPWER
jgi:hypothetical protein